MSSLGTTVTTEANEDDLASSLGEARKVKRWVQEIKFYETKSQQWVEKGKKILRRYKDDRSPREQRVPRFNILWSVIESAVPALFGNNPKPDIERRFRDKDDLGRVSSMILERSITYFVNEAFGDVVRQAVKDRLLPGRGTVWARYEPHFRDSTEDENEEVADEGYQITDDVESYGGIKKSTKDTTGDDYDEDDNEAAPQEIEDEVVCWDYVHWQDFGHTFGRTWNEVDAGWRKVYLTREELIERFGEDIGSKITLDYSPHDLKDNKYDEVQKKATVYEIWDKQAKKVLWIHKDFASQPLDEKDDPLGLEGFWPFPMPLFATLGNDDCIPVPDYIEWQDQAHELDELTSRIGAITKAVKVAGVYDKSAPGIERVLAEGVENQLIPVDQWAIFAEKGGLKGVMELLPMQEIMATLTGLYEARDKVKQDLYEISGSADIMRGQSDPDETATAQTIKSQFGTMRLDDKQEQVKRFCRDLVKIGTQIIANHFSIDTIKKICGMQLLTAQEKQLVQMRMQALQQYAQQQKAMAAAPPQGAQASPSPQASVQQPLPPPQLPPLPSWLQKCDQEEMDELMSDPTWEEVDELFHNETMLAYKIDIETDSTIKINQDADRDARVQFLDATGKFLQSAMQNQNPDLAPLLAKLLEFGVRGFKVGKELEGAFDVAIRKLEKDASDPSKKKPDPETMKIQGQMQLEQTKLQNDKQLKTMQMQLDQQKAQADSQAEIQRLEMQAKVDTNQAQLDANLAAQKSHQDDAREMAIAKMDNETKIAVAQIQAKTQLQNTAITAFASGSKDGEAPTMPEMSDLIKTVVDQLQQGFSGMSEALAKPKTVIRDKQGNISGVQ